MTDLLLLLKRVKYFLFMTLMCFFARTAFSQCSGFQIVANKSSVCAPDIIRFHILNPVAGSTYEWDVGNGVVYGADTLYSFFTASRTVDAFVKITLPNGVVCNVSNNAIAVVNPIPTPAFTASDVRLCYGADSVEFTDATLNSVNRSWVIQGTNYSNTANSIKHNFVTPGLKKVSLIVTDTNGCIGVREFFDTIQIFDDPTFSFVADKKVGCAPLDVTLSMKNDPSVAGYTKTYNWSFTGNTNSTDNSATPSTRTYVSAGKYPVGLKVEVSNGCTYNIEQNDTIRVGDTVALGLIVSDDTVCTGELITFNQTNLNLSGKLGWSFSGVSQSTISKDNNTAVIKPTTRGNVSVILNYVNNGCNSSKAFINIARVNGVASSFSSNNNFHCKVPHTVDLTNTSNSLDANLLTYKWRVLDGGSEIFTSTSENSSFTFNTLPGLYDVELIAIGDNGCRDTIKKNGFIYQDSLLVDFEVLPKIVCIGQEMTVLNITKPSTYMYPDSFKWTFFDENGIAILDSSKDRNPRYTYSKEGFYDIEVIGYNDAGCRDTLRKNGVVEVIKSELNYSLSDSILCKGVKFSLDGFSTPSKANYAYNWRFEHATSASVFSVAGKNAVLSPPLLGEYRLVISHNINGGCILNDTSTVHVNGLDFSIKLDTSNGCAPLQVKPEVEITNDYFRGAADSAYSYLWSAVQNSGIIESDVTTETPTFSFTKNGDYTVNLSVTNATSKCSSKRQSTKILTGVRSAFIISDNRICLGDSLSITDLSQNGVTDVEWDVFPETAFTTTVVSPNSMKLSIQTPGLYTLRQIVTNNGDCYDTTILPFEIIETIADFQAVDSFLQCAPIYAEFQSYSSNADTLIWDFGTGDVLKTISSSAATIYQRNSGWVNGYDIKLIAKNVEGCTDTSIREDYLVVAGPTPAFEMENFVGCEPLNVRFTDKSEDSKTFYLNYNDGSPLDSTKTGDFIGANDYVMQSPTAMRQAIMPNIIVYDSVGCAAVFEPLDSIIVFRKPSVKTVFENGVNLCSSFNIVFEDTGSFTNNRNWYFDAINISSNAKDSIVESVVGTHEIKLVSSNSNNCVDSIAQVIEVYETPRVSFTVADTICINNLAAFKGSVQSTNPTNNLRWNFGEDGSAGNTNFTDLNPVFMYTTKGVKNIKFVAGIDNGCTDSAEASVLITDETDIDVPEINYVSFEENYKLEIDFSKSTYSKYSKYVVGTGLNDVDIFDIDQLKHIVNYTEAPLASECFTVRVGDYCDLLGEKSAAHCFIVLSVTSSNAFTNDLSWTPYIGWSAVKEYQVFRKDENEVFVKIATLDGATTSYEDTQLCNQDYEYYVAAIHPTQNWESKSYRVVQRPMYFANSRLSSVKNVTVTDVNEISIEWVTSDYSQFKNYKLLKYKTTFDNLVEEIDLNDTFYLDNDVMTNDFSYIYQILEEDRCGYINEPNKEGKSILLNGVYNDGSNLYWTKYENWESGVMEYNIEIKKQTGFEFIHSNDRNDIDYLDKKLYREISGEYCYRVYGVSHTGDTSYSNTTCLSGDPKIFIPNAFSPNSDGLNDNFNPIMFFMKDGDLEEINGFSLIIFNRWGEKVFETNNPRGGWDGSYKGTECQPGAYVYKVKATGLNDLKIYKDGTIAIIR